MSSILNLVSAELFERKTDELAAAMRAIANSAAQIAGADKPYPPSTLTTFAAVQGIVRMGLADSFFNVRRTDAEGNIIQNGTLFECSCGTQNPNIIWEVIGIDTENVTDSRGIELTTLDETGNIIPAHSLTLQTRYALANGISGMNKNEFKFNRTADAEWAASDARCWLNSTSATGIPTHQKFIFAESRTFIVNDAPVELERVEANGVVLLPEEYAYSGGALTLTVSPPDNAIICVFYKNPSAVAYAENVPGFLAPDGLDSELQAVTAYRKSRTNGRDIIDRVFLPSKAEVGFLSSADTLMDDVFYPAFISAQGRVKTDEKTVQCAWWTRSGTGSSPTYIRADGSFDANTATQSFRFAPAIVIA